LFTAIRQQNIEELRRLHNQDYVSPLPRNADQFNTPLFLAISLLTDSDIESQHWTSETESDDEEGKEVTDKHSEESNGINSRVQIVKYLISVAREQKAELDAKIPSWFLRTALHKASNEGIPPLVSMLLHAGANPTLTPGNLDPKTPYDLAKDKPTRDIFRKFAGSHPDMWDWGQAHVPLLTRHMEKQMQKKKFEKLKKKRREKKEKSKAAKLQEEKKLQELKIIEEIEQEQLELKVFQRSAKSSEFNVSERKARTSS